MNFWQRVDYLREYKNIPRKELAYKADFSLNSISTGIARNSIPAADVAYRIAQVLDVSVEYLLTEKKSNNKNSENQLDQFLKEDESLFFRYREILRRLDVIDEKTREKISDMIEVLFIAASDKKTSKN